MKITPFGIYETTLIGNLSRAFRVACASVLSYLEDVTVDFPKMTINYH